MWVRKFKTGLLPIAEPILTDLYRRDTKVIPLKNALGKMNLRHFQFFDLSMRSWSFKFSKCFHFSRALTFENTLLFDEISKYMK